MTGQQQFDHSGEALQRVVGAAAQVTEILCGRIRLSPPVRGEGSGVFAVPDEINPEGPQEGADGIETR
jgi:hypothetical protein